MTLGGPFLESPVGELAPLTCAPTERFMRSHLPCWSIHPSTSEHWHSFCTKTGEGGMDGYAERASRLYSPLQASCTYGARFGGSVCPPLHMERRGGLR